MIYFPFSNLCFPLQTLTIHSIIGKGEAVSLTPLYHFHPLHRHLDISWAIIADIRLAITADC